MKSHNNAQERGIHYPKVKNLSLKWKLPQIRVNEGQLKTLIGTKRDKAFKALSAENNCTYCMTNVDLREYIYENEIILTWEAHNNKKKKKLNSNHYINRYQDYNYYKPYYCLNRFPYFSKMQL